jgi:hypothetical protein
MTALKERDPRLIRYALFGAIGLVLLCLIGYLVYNIFTADISEVAQTTPVPTAATTAEPAPVADATEEPTATPTRVIEATPTPRPTNTPAPTATATPTVAVTVIAQGDSGGSGSSGSTSGPATTNVVSIVPGPKANVLKNGDFEGGFAGNGVALEWTPFKNDDVIAVYSAEAPGPYVASGDQAQRITTAQARVGDRYAGIYQQIEVIPNQTYTLRLQGQIRSGFGDVNKSSFGYRMQYAISQRAIKNWQVVPAEDWVELPWDEQLLHSPDTQFGEYSADIVPTSEQITLFIRAWHKWADPGQAEFTLDDVSLTGPTVMVEAIAMTATEDEAGQAFVPAGGTSTTGQSECGSQSTVDKGLPTTGAISQSLSFAADGRFWGALGVLLLLVIGATFRGKWSA